MGKCSINVALNVLNNSDKQHLSDNIDKYMEL